MICDIMKNIFKITAEIFKKCIETILRGARNIQATFLPMRKSLSPHRSGLVVVVVTIFPHIAHVVVL